MSTKKDYSVPAPKNNSSLKDEIKIFFTKGPKESFRREREEQKRVKSYYDQGIKEGKWTKKTSGGGPNRKTYYKKTEDYANNPQNYSSGSDTKQYGSGSRDSISKGLKEGAKVASVTKAHEESLKK